LQKVVDSAIASHQIWSTPYFLYIPAVLLIAAIDILHHVVLDLMCYVIMVCFAVVCVVIW